MKPLVSTILAMLIGLPLPARGPAPNAAASKQSNLLRQGELMKGHAGKCAKGSWFWGSNPTRPVAPSHRRSLPCSMVLIVYPDAPTGDDRAALQFPFSSVERAFVLNGTLNQNGVLNVRAALYPDGREVAARGVCTSNFAPPPAGYWLGDRAAERDWMRQIDRPGPIFCRDIREANGAPLADIRIP